MPKVCQISRPDLSARVLSCPPSTQRKDCENAGTPETNRTSDQRFRKGPTSTPPLCHEWTRSGAQAARGHIGQRSKGQHRSGVNDLHCAGSAARGRRSCDRRLPRAHNPGGGPSPRCCDRALGGGHAHAGASCGQRRNVVVPGPCTLRGARAGHRHRRAVVASRRGREEHRRRHHAGECAPR